MFRSLFPNNNIISYNSTHTYEQNLFACLVSFLFVPIKWRMWYGEITSYLLLYALSMENYLGVGSRFGFTVPEREAQIIRLDKRTYLEQMYRLRNNGVKSESYKDIST